MKKFVSLFLALLMCLSLAGGIGSALAEAEPTVLTIGDINDRPTYEGPDRSRVWDKIEEELNIKIDFIYLPEDTYAAVMASGDLPDIVHPNNDLSTIMQSGLALDVQPYLEEYCPNLVTGAAAATYELYLELLTGGDGFYFFPCGIGYNGVGYSSDFNTRGYVVRWDYYKELGCPPINNDEDYLNVLIQMQANHPTTEDGYPTYLYGIDNWKGYDTAFRTNLSVDYWAAYKYQNNIFTNEIYDGYVDVENSMWWAATEWYNKLYNAGIENGTFDIDLFTMTKDEFSVKRERGQYMGLHNGNGSLYDAKVKEDPDTISGYCTVPTAPSNWYTNVYQLMGNGSAYMGFISANSENWEVALKFYNYMYDPDFLRYNALGEQGVTWDYDENGVPQMTEFGKEQYDAPDKKDDPENYYYNWSINENNVTGLRDNMMHPDGYPINFYSGSREYVAEHVTNNVAKDMAEYYGTELASDAFYEAGGLDFRNDAGEAISSVMTGLDADQLRIIASCDEILEGRQADLIMAETEEEYLEIQAEVIEEIKALGEEEVFKAYQEQWDAVAAIMGPLVKEAQAANGREPYTEEDWAHLPIAD